MGLFSRKATRRDAAAAPSGLQLPDQLSQEAEQLYGTQQFSAATEKYAEAVDKLHTMCVVAAPGSRIRNLSADDAKIFAGFDKSLGAALAMDPTTPLESEVRKVMAYGRQMANEAMSVGVDPNVYTAALESIESTFRRGRG